jgi:hypothetical protein
VDFVSLLGGLVQRLRLGWLFNRFLVGVEGRATICTDDHIAIYFYPSPPRPPAPRHVDVSAQLWNNGSQPLTAFEVTDAEAASQVLVPEDPGNHGSFKEVTLEVGGRRVEEDFQLRPPKGEELQAQGGDEVRLRIRMNRGPGRSVKLVLIEEE